MQIKAITLYQPWAYFVAHGYKTIETRSWSTSHRGPILIHSAMSLPSWGKDMCLDQPYRDILEKEGQIAWSPAGKPVFQFPLGALVAVANLVDVKDVADLGELSLQERAMGDFREGRVGWLLKDAMSIFPPVYCKGRQGLWVPGEDTLRQLGC